MIKLILLVIVIGFIVGMIINWSAVFIQKSFYLIGLATLVSLLVWSLTSLSEIGLNLATYGLILGTLFSLKTNDSKIKRNKRIIYLTLLLSSICFWIIFYGEIVELN